MNPAVCTFPGNVRFGDRLRAELQADSLPLHWRRFPDGESHVRYGGSLAGRSLAIVCTLNDPDSKVLALLFAARTAKELGATRVGLVAPYLGYMRQDRRFESGEAVTSVHFAALLSGAFDWLVTVDPHLHRRSSLAEIYSIPAAIVAAAPAVAAWIAEHVSRPLVVGPDAESEQWAADIAGRCGAPYVVMSKRRRGDTEVEIRAPDLAAWRDRTPVVIDDIVSSARTMALAVRRTLEQGLTGPVCVGVHGVFSGDAAAALAAAGAETVVTANTIEHATNAIDVAPLVAAKVRELAAGTARPTGDVSRAHY